MNWRFSMSDYINGRDPMEEEPAPRRRFRLFDSQREGRGVSKDDAKITPDLGGFFRSFGRNFTKLLSVNLLTLLGNFPLLFAILALSGLFKTQYMTPVSGYFVDLHALMLSGGAQDPAAMAIFGVLGKQMENSAMTTVSYVLFGLSAITLFTFGLTKVGTTYILRSLVRGEPVFMISDFKYAAKRNLRQAIPMGIIDLIAIFLFPALGDYVRGLKKWKPHLFVLGFFWWAVTAFSRMTVGAHYLTDVTIAGLVTIISYVIVSFVKRI